MKILHVALGLQKVSGVTTFVENVVSELRTIGHQVDVWTKDKVEKRDGQWNASDYDVVHVHGLWDLWLLKIARQAKKVIWSTHGMTAPWSLKHKWWKKCLFWYLLQKPALKRAALIHSTVEKERDWNEALGFKHHLVAPLGTNLPRLKEAKRRDESERKTLLFVGRIHPVKAIDNLIKAFAAANVPGWQLRIVGPNQDGHQAELEKIIEQCKVQCSKFNVEFIGPKFGAELAAEYENCDILALVSHTENFGATVVDAMAHGKPVITGTKTPWKEVADLSCGWWVDNDVESLASTLRSALNTPTSTLEAMGANGRALVEAKYTWSAVAKALAKAYEFHVRVRPFHEIQKAH